MPLTGKGAIRLMVPRGATDRITAKMVYVGPVRAPVQQGQAIGRLQVWRNDLKALEVPLQAAENVGTRCVPEVVIGQRFGQRVDERQCCGGAVGHRHCYCVVEGDDRSGVERVQALVDRGDLRPVGCRRNDRVRVNGGDRRLQRVGSWTRSA